jgi:outer membrane protein OmpA-like peptidoglycan-associated protein
MVLIICSVAAPAQKQENPPKSDLFIGYQWLDPGGSIPSTTVTNGVVQPFKLPSMPHGGGAAFGYNFHPNFAVEGDFGASFNGGNDITTYSVGPRFTYRGEGVNLFIHTLLGDNRLATNSFGSQNGIGAILGGGIDLNVIKHLSIRLIEADYQWAKHNFAKEVPATQPDLRRPGYEGARLRAGLVFNFGGAPPVPPSAACSVDHAEVMQGEPVAATVSGSNFNPKHTLTYSWTSNGGTVSGKDNAATIDTKGVAGGTYNVTAHVADPKVKKGGEASCTASFAVKEPPKNPPTMSCSASPTTLQPGGTADITCTCTSPDGVPVTVSGWTATSGTVSGSGNAATLNSAGASPGPITVNATCTDSRGLSTAASSAVTVQAPPAPSPELEARLALHSIYFPTDMPKATQPSGGLVESQQRTLLSLASDFQKYLQARPDAKLILAGHADKRGSPQYNMALSQRRVERTKSFLVEHGVPEANIDTKAFGEEENMTPDQVKAAVETNPDLNNEERQRILKNIQTIVLASNRRVDVTLSTTGQESVRHFPFNAADSLTLIGGRTAELKKAPARKTPAKKP